MSHSHSTPNYSAGNDRFNTEASTYDEKHGAAEVAKLCSKALTDNIPELEDGTSKEKEWTAIEIGAGTGLLSRELLPYFKSVLGVDPSQGMLDEFEKKSKQAKEEGKGEMKGVKVLLDNPHDPILDGKKFNLAVSHLVFHHIPDMYRTIEVMKEILVSGGVVAISDFINDANAFRDKGVADGVHRHGLVPEEIKEMMQRAGLKDVQVKKTFSFDMNFGGDHQHSRGDHHSHEAHQHEHNHGEKSVEKKEKVKMNFLLCTGRK